jgi:hypothetical protein
MYSCSTETVSLAKRLHGLLADEHHYEDDVEVARSDDAVAVRGGCELFLRF